jgi:hypothetical protein
MSQRSSSSSQPHGEEHRVAMRLEHRKSAIADLRTHSADPRVNPGSVAACSAHPSRRRFAPPQDEGSARIAPPALLFAARARRPLSLLRRTKARGSGAPRGAPTFRAGERGAGLAKPARLTALRCGDFAPRGRASGHWTEDSSPSRAGGFRRPSSVPVQPSKAEPRSGPGRLPGASRVRGCEPRPRAPHQPAPGLPGSGPLKSLHLVGAPRRRPRVSEARDRYINAYIYLTIARI